MEHFFYRLYHLIQRNKLKAIGALALFLSGILFLSLQLKFEEDITKLIPENDEAKTLNKVLDQVDFADKIVVLIQKKKDGTTKELTTVASKLVDSLEVVSNDYISEIQGIVNDEDFEEAMDFVYENLPLFLNKDDYKTITERISKTAIQKKTEENYKTLISPSGIVARKTLLKDPLGISFLGLSKLKELQLGDDFNIKDGFVITQDEQNILLFIKPKLASNETDKNTFFVKKLNEFKSILNEKYSNKVSVSYYGATVVAVANAQQIKTDIQLTVSIALSILFLILILFYKKIMIPLVLFLPTVFGALLAIAVLYLFRGTISAISIGIGSVLLGITLDYSLHILTHYRNSADIKELYKDVAKPVVMSSITTALAFLCLLFIKSRALQDLGVFAAVSVAGSSFFALLLIPHLYKRKESDSDSQKTVLDKIASIPFGKKKLLILGCLLLFVVTLFTYNEVKFDKDISKMNYQSEELLKAEEELNSLINTASKSLYVVSYGETFDKAMAANYDTYKELQAFKEDQKILDFSAVSGIILPRKEQEKRIKNWDAYWSHQRDSVKAYMIESGLSFGFKPKTFDQFYNKLGVQQQVLSIQDFSELKSLLVNEFIANKDQFHTVLSSLKVNSTNVNQIKAHFSNKQQTVVIDRQAMNETFLSNFKDNFNTLLGYSFIAVVLVLLVFFRRIELVLITITPIALTWLATIGLMGILGISFNIFNIIISTFIFGLGVDYAIFMTNGLIKEYETGKRHLPVYRVSIILSMITTILGVGVLIFAKHPALRSISIVSLIGIISAVFITFIIQPILFRGIITCRAKKGLAPLTFRKTIHSFFSFLLYGAGGMFLSLLAITIFKVLPVSKKRKFKWLHNSMAKLATTVLYSNPFVTKRVIKNKKTLEKQAIIIANHTSFLDTLAIALVTPKVVFLVNDWVYKSPIFGQLAKVAGYYPVSKGVDGSLDHLKKKVNQGYSLIVFPEGRRMYSNKIGRFHKGAFFLAQQLKMDIVPLYIHGNSEVLPKGDFIIYDGAITVKVGDRISANDPIFNEDAKTLTKYISSLYRNEFHQLRNELEGVNYFKNQLLNNFIYKSKKVQEIVIDDFSSNKELYHKLNDVVPMKTKILHIGNDYGQLDIFLKYKSNERKIVSYIADEKKRTIAKHNYVGKDYPITYVDFIEEKNSAKVLLLGFDVKELDNIAIDLNSLEIIIILNETFDTSLLIDNGYSIKEDKEFLVLRKK